MKRATIILHSESIKKVLDLPDDVHIASITQDGPNKELLHLVVLCERDELPNISIDHTEGLDRIGYAFRHPEEFQQDNKGTVKSPDEKTK
jgi:hypothetical protein